MISYSMLCNSVTVYKQSGYDEDRNPIEDDGTELSRVYCVATKAQRDGTQGKESGSSMTLYYDVQNSKPLNFTFALGDRVVFEGVSYTVNSIAPYYNANGLQHYEIGLN